MSTVARGAQPVTSSINTTELEQNRFEAERRNAVPNRRYGRWTRGVASQDPVPLRERDTLESRHAEVVIARNELLRTRQRVARPLRDTIVLTDKHPIQRDGLYVGDYVHVLRSGSLESRSSFIQGQDPRLDS